MTFGRAELVAFLRQVDSKLTRPARIRLIGGAVAGLRYLPAYKTRDIDYAWADREVQTIIDEIQREHPEMVAGQTGTYFAPYDFEDRLEILAVPGLVYLRVEAPERHDLAIMKLARGYDRDVETVSEIHRIEPLQLRTLVERYEQTWMTGPQRLRDLGFLSAIDTLFGATGAEEAESTLLRLRGTRR